MVSTNITSILFNQSGKDQTQQRTADDHRLQQNDQTRQAHVMVTVQFVTTTALQKVKLSK